MTTANQVYSVAKSHLGHHGSHARAYCGMSSGPYCCAFVTMCMQKSGGGKLFYGGKKCTYCPNAIKWCQANLAQVPPYLAMRMDIIFFDWQPNGTPDHIGFVLDKISTDKIRTLEGNTSGGIVAVKTRGGYIQGIFRPHYTPEKMPTKAPLEPDGDFGYKSIYMLQIALGLKPDAILGKQTVKKLQQLVGATPDGAWGPKTSKLIQSKLCGFSGKAVDGAFGPASVKAFQKWINSKCFPKTKPVTTTKPSTPTTKPTTQKPATTTKPAAKPSTPTRKKMSRIAHARKDYDGKAGDSSGREVCKTKFTYNPSNKSVYDWSYVFRPKDISKADKAASMAEKACANSAIGYSKNGETAYGKSKAMTKLAKKAKYDLSKIKTKCGLSCGDLICLCNHYAGLSTCYIGSAKPLSENLKKNKNFECITYKKGMQLYRGDTLITAHSNGKNNHVVMCV